MNPFTFVLNDSGLASQSNSTDDNIAHEFSLLNALAQLVDVSGYTGTTPSAHYAYVVAALTTYGVAPYARNLINSRFAPRIQFYSRGY